MNPFLAEMDPGKAPDYSTNRSNAPIINQADQKSGRFAMFIVSAFQFCTSVGVRDWGLMNRVAGVDLGAGEKFVPQ